MIQRKQTLFLFLSGFLNVALLFIPGYLVTINGTQVEIPLVPLKHVSLQATAGHNAAIALNFLGLLLAFVTVFIYLKRETQIKLCYANALLWLVIAGMTAFCPFVISGAEVTAITHNYSAPLICIGGIAALMLAVRYIKKDIELLKSADRIR